ncbi:MAG TPA: cytochrome C oxidase subunit II [Methylomirabilota bacterium]|jgi:cytochrome c oxidase subunit 2|nr:cytochrome C oxidase subunit II [Methylomirabilota bacterium]
MIAYLVPRAASFAGDIDGLFTLILFTVGFWFLVAQGALFTFIFRFRRRDGVRAQYITGEQKAEKRWIAIPHFLVILCDIVLIAGTIMVWVNVKQTLPPAEETVRIIAQQWAWTFVQPGPDGKLDTGDDITTIDELHVKTDTVYHFELVAKDVIHSFSVPVFRLKQDAVPGRIITGWFKPIRTGQFDIQCAEMCGIGHGLMGARLVIESKADHEQWMSAQRPEAGLARVALR